VTQPQTVTARLQWAGREYTVAGVLAPTFLVENGRVLVRLDQVSPQLDGLTGTSLWVPAGQVEAPGGLTLRSHLCSIPPGQERDYALRTLILPVTRYVRDHCLRIELWAGLPRFVELSLAIAVPTEHATEYLWDLAVAGRLGQSRPLQWQPPRQLLAAAEPDPKERASAAHYVGQLPLYLSTQQYWSVFRWDGQRLVHILQFSLEDKLRRTLETRLGLKPVNDL